MKKSLTDVALDRSIKVSIYKVGVVFQFVPKVESGYNIIRSLGEAKEYALENMPELHPLDRAQWRETVRNTKLSDVLPMYDNQYFVKHRPSGCVYVTDGTRISDELYHEEIASEHLGNFNLDWDVPNDFNENYYLLEVKWESTQRAVIGTPRMLTSETVWSHRQRKGPC